MQKKLLQYDSEKEGVKSRRRKDCRRRETWPGLSRDISVPVTASAKNWAMNSAAISAINDISLRSLACQKELTQHERSLRRSSSSSATVAVCPFVSASL